MDRLREAMDMKTGLVLEGGGMRGVAVISAIFGAENIEAAAQQLKQEAISATER